MSSRAHIPIYALIVHLPKRRNSGLNLCQSGSAGLHPQLGRVLQDAELERLFVQTVEVQTIAVQTIGDHRQLVGGGRLVDVVKTSRPGTMP
jgi:hypothetical protein